MRNNHITKEALDTLSRKQFAGKIHVIDKLSKVKDAASHLKAYSVLGFDTETRPSFKKGVVNQVALLQLATEEEALLIRINKIGIPDEILHIIADPNILKVGVAISDDIKHLHHIRNFKPKGFIELQDFVKNYGIADFSLKKIAGLVLNIKISKRQQLSNWENQELTAAQQRYAATDAWAPLAIYNKLLSSGFND